MGGDNLLDVAKQAGVRIFTVFRVPEQAIYPV
jgi:hypothetical protein